MSAVQNIAVPPHNPEAEKSVLGAVLLDERHLFALLVEEHLRPEHFYVERHALVFTAMLEVLLDQDRKSTRLNSSHANISYAVFCLKKKKTNVPVTCAQ